MTKLALVYQAGIGNVFDVAHLSADPGTRGRTKLVQCGDFRTCSQFAKGAAYAGAAVRTYSCNRAGQIHEETWTPGLDDCPFRAEAIEVES